MSNNAPDPKALADDHDDFPTKELPTLEVRTTCRKKPTHNAPDPRALAESIENQISLASQTLRSGDKDQALEQAKGLAWMLVENAPTIIDALRAAADAKEGGRDV